MPNCYQATDNHQAIANTLYQRADFNIAKTAIVYCCFNQFCKIDASLFNIWMGILQKVPNSILWLLADNNIAINNLRQQALKYNISTNRLVFAKRLPKIKHLARMQLADIALDTFTYNGHTTTTDALWAGIPVITLQGNHFASRVSASLLKAINMPSLITTNKQDYKQLAIKLATNSKLLKKTKLHINYNKHHAMLFNTKQFASDLEQIYKKIYTAKIMQSTT